MNGENNDSKIDIPSLNEALKDPKFKEKFEKDMAEFIKKQNEEKMKPITMKNLCNCCCCRRY